MALIPQEVVLGRWGVVGTEPGVRVSSTPGTTEPASNPSHPGRMQVKTSKAVD